MVSVVFHVIFSLITIYFLLQIIGFALYEINTLNNKIGGIAVVTFSIVVIVFANIVVWLLG